MRLKHHGMSPAVCIGIVAVVIVLLLTAAEHAGAFTLTSEFSINIKEKDRVLGSLQGNILVYGRPHITMYSNRGQQIFTRKLKNNVKPAVSPDGNHLALITYADRSPTDLKTVKLEMFDRRGKFRWKLDKPPANDYRITNKGSFLGIEGVQGISPTRVYVYDQFGDRVTILVFKNYQGILPAPSGSKFIIDKGRDGLVVYDSLGKEQGLLPAARNFCIDADERYIGAFSDGVFRLYQDEKEVVTIKYPEATIRDLALNVEADLVVLMGETHLGVYGLTTGQLRWDYQLLEKEMNFTSLDLAADGGRFACGVDVNLGDSVSKDERHVEGFIYLFSSDRKKMTRHRETYGRWGVGFPKAAFSSAGGSVIVQTREKLEKFRLR